MGECTSKSSKPEKALKTRELSVDPNAFVRIKKGNIRDSYKLKDKINEGAFGVVYIAENLTSHQERAVKIISISPSEVKDAENLLREVAILKEMDNPHIIKIYEVFQSETNLSIVTEYCRGGELYSRIVDSEGFSENQAAVYIHQMASAVNYLHSKGIIHRDLKPENMLFETEDPNSKLKLIDFGTCKHFKKNTKLVERIGSSYYIAPEVILSNYDEKCDVWSLGVILFIMLCGSPPFGGKSNSEIMSSILMKEARFDPKKWKNVSDEAIELVKSMLNKNVPDRISAEKVINHPWVKKFTSKDVLNKKIARRTFKNLSKFTTSSKLHRATLSYIVNQIMTTEQLAGLRDLFQSLDENGDGFLSTEELKKGSQGLPGEFAENLEKIVANVDEDRNGQINYSEFLIAATNWQKELSRERLHAAFQEFDKDGSGGISVEELVETLGGGSAKDHVFVEMVRQADTNNDGQIDLEEFIAFMERLKESEDI